MAIGVRTLIEQRVEGLLRASFPTQRPTVYLDGMRFLVHWRGDELRPLPGNLMDHLHLDRQEARDLAQW
jgi:hypothetical protein